MKSNIFFTILAGIILLAACNKEELGELPFSEHTIYATLPSDDAQTRTTIKDLQVVWSENDAISIFAVDGGEYTNNEGTLASGAGTTSATFNVIIDGHEKVAAVYPFMDETIFSNSDGAKISMTLPAEYEYIENGIGGAPMASLISNQTAPVSFKNAGALMGLTVNNIPEGYNQATLTSSTEAITGPCEITFDSEGKPTIRTTSEATGKVITINFDAAQTPCNKTFYFPIPVGDYTSLELSISNGTDVKVLKTKGLNAERSMRYKSTTTLDVVSGETPVEANGASEATNKLAGGDNSVNVTITSEENDPTISLPAREGQISLSFEPIPTGNTVTIQATTENVVSDDVNISVSSDENSENSFDIQLPNSTVTLNANGEEATYKQVTALTAANTLIIGTGVTVNNLIVKGGNVKVYGVVSAISRHADNTDAKTYIFKEEGAVIPENLGEEFVVIENLDEWDGENTYPATYDEASMTYSVKNAYELAWIAEYVNAGNNLDGVTVTLTEDIDLNNKNWTPIGFNSNEEAGNEPYFSGTFDGNEHTISNLKIDVTDKGGVGLFGAVHNATFKNFTLNNVDIKAIELEDDPVDTSGDQGGKGEYIVGGQIGAVAGYDADNGTLTFENINLTGLIKIEGETRAVQGQRIGGVFGGKGYSTVTFENVSVIGDEGSYIKGYCTTAGVAGQPQGVAQFNNVNTDIDVYVVKFGAAGISGFVANGSSFENCSSAGIVNLDASKEKPNPTSANNPYRIGAIAGCWGDSKKEAKITLTNCSYIAGSLISKNNDGVVTEVFDYAGYVGRGYTLNGRQGSTVTIDGVSYVQAFDEAANSGVYYINDELIINSAANLKVLATKVNSGNNYFEGKTVKLTNDIDLNNEEWTPIGSFSQDHGFMGNFDGQNHKIKNLKITDETTAAGGYAYLGLFGVSEGSESSKNTIKNLVIENVNISSAGQIVSAAIAYPYYTIVENITVQGDINITGGNYTAGILAYTRRCVDAKDLEIKGNTGSSITGASTVGGVISDIQMNGGLTANYSNFSASGLTISANANVGGISGIISAQTLDGATVNNVVISCAEGNKTIGIVSGALGSTSIVKNISYSNVSGATNNIGAMYNTGNPAYCHGPYEADNKYYFVPEVTVSGSDEIDKMREALSNGAYIKMVDGFPIQVEPVNGVCFIHTNKSIIDGKDGYYIWNLNGNSSTIQTSGGVLKNLEFWQGSVKAINIVAPTSKVVLENVVVVKERTTNYAFHCDSGNGYGLEATNCQFYAFISYAESLGDVKFTNCTFGANNNTGTKGINTWAPTEFVDCAFEVSYTVNLNEDATVTFENCTYNGVTITADNLTDVVTGETQNASVK